MKEQKKPESPHREEVITFLKMFEEKLKQGQLIQDAQRIHNRIYEYNTRKLQISFMGPFDTGKSTLLNALLRKNVLRTHMRPETAVITKIVNGMDGEVLLVWKNPNRDTWHMDRETFFERFHAGETGNTMFSEIKHAELFCSSGWENVTFVDTPGLQHTGLKDNAVEEYIFCSDAIVFVLNALLFLNDEGRNFVKRYFAGKENVFFAVNWCNMIPAHEYESAAARIKEELREVLDEKLFEKRVFFIDAQLSECARCGIPVIQRKGTRSETVYLPESEDEYSGVPELEEAIQNYIYSEAGIQESYSVCLMQMEEMTEKAGEIFENRVSLFKCGEQEIEALLQNVENNRRILEDEMSRINDVFIHSKNVIKRKLSEIYDEFCWSVEKDWEGYFKEKEIAFGILDQGKMAMIGFRSGISELFHKWKKEPVPEKEILLKDQKLSEIIEPIYKAIEQYIQKKVAVLVKNTKDLCIQEFLNLSQELAEYCMNLQGTGTEEIEKAVETILKRNGKKIRSQKVNLSPDQMILSMLLFQNATLAYDTMFHEYSLNDLLVEGTYRKIYYSGVTAIIGVITGSYVAYVLAVIAYNLIRQEEKAEKLGLSIVMHAKESMTESLKTAKHGFIDEIEKEILLTAEENINLFKQEILNEKEEQVLEYQRLMMKREHTQSEIEQQAEDFQRILRDMKTICQDMNSYLLYQKKRIPEI